MKEHTLLPFLLAIIAFACSCNSTSRGMNTNSDSTISTKKNKVDMTIPATVYYIFEDGLYREGELDSEMEPIGGEKQFLTTVYRTIKYPPAARNNGVQGIVLVTVVINELGQMESAEVKRGIGSGCDEEALASVKRGGEAGFVPAVKNGKAVKVKYDIPVKFKLE